MAASEVFGDARGMMPEGGTVPVGRAQTFDGADQHDGAQANGAQGGAAVGLMAPSLGEGFVLAGSWLAPGLVGLNWDDVADVSSYELLVYDGDEWTLLAGSTPVGGLVAMFEGSAARVGGLSEEVGEYWFAVRARSILGVSRWSGSVEVPVPGELDGNLAQLSFDPFTAPTLSNIDLERLAAAVATVSPGQADCTAVPALDVAGISVVDPPASLNDPDAPLTVAEVVRISGGCVVVEHVELAGRTVAQVRTLLAAETSVHAVGEPIRGLIADHEDTPGYAHPMPKTSTDPPDDTGHYNDGYGAQWHLTPAFSKMGVGLWDNWDETVTVVVAVLDTGVGITHPDLDDRVAPGGLGGCHTMDANGHGTHVAGIIAAERSKPSLDQGVAGVAPNAQILPIRVLRRDECPAHITPRPLTPPAGVAEAVNRGARVINMSLSGTTRHDIPGVEAGGVVLPSVDTYELVLRAASMLGVVTVVSASNCGDNSPDSDGKPRYEANNCGEHNQERRPALYPDTIAVAAIKHDTDIDRVERAKFSTANRHVDVAAPGGEILSTDCTRSATEPRPCAAYDAYGGRSGTSQAAPFVSGVVAHMINRYPEATAGQIRHALENTARAPLDDPADLTVRGRESDTRTGGLIDQIVRFNSYVDVCNSDPANSGKPMREKMHLPTMEYGRGIVNPAAAVARLGEDIAAAGRALVPSGDEGPFVELSAGARHTCGLRQNGAVQCWGERAIHDATPEWAFESLSSPPTERFVCGVRVDGAAQCWGDLPLEITSQVAVPTSTGALRGRFVEVAAGDRHVCGIRPDFRSMGLAGLQPAGAVVCWGDNSDGQTAVPDGLVGFGESEGGRAIHVYAGSSHSCALTATSVVTCWGDNDDMQLPTPSLRASDAALGEFHSCAVKSMGVVECFSAKTDGQATAPAGRFASVDAGANHSCGLLARDRDLGILAGELRCWGQDGKERRLAAPSGVFKQVSAGQLHSCALSKTGDVRCWGDNEHGQAPSDSSPRLSALSLVVDGVDVLAGKFDPAVFAYSVTARAGEATLRAVADAAGGLNSRVVMPTGSGGESFPLSREGPVVLADRGFIIVRVGALYGMGARRAYVISVSTPPTLDSLRLIPSGTGP
ncbi:S8 family serine peptidase [Candidatus Poriferisodalis sp.]|uniref:S8 family serine peptidase n=1 Tax=Candidatus Poriferisodalis sp. TaxID=3101277 RepID=UPI003B01FDF5